MQLNGINYCDYCFAQKENTAVCPKCGLSQQTYNLEVGLLAPGCNLDGKYIIGRALGRGGFGATYIAYSAALNKVVAIKEYLPMNISYRGKGEEEVSVVSDEKRATFEAGKQRFVEEAQMIRRFNSKDNIVTVYEYFYANNTAYYAMEYLEGTDLRKYIVSCGGKLSEDVVIKVMRDVCNALVWVHSTMNVHRDIAPDNIFVCQNGEIKLIDFGAARAVVTGGQLNYSVVLKQGFAPPEQYMTNGEQGPWTDIYAVGATVYYALTGCMPTQALDRLQNATLTFEGYKGNNVRLKQIICKCMETDKNRRYQNALEVLDALEKLEVSQPPKPPKPPQPIPTPPQPAPKPPQPKPPIVPSVFSNKLVWLIVGLVVVLVILLVFGFIKSMNDETDTFTNTNSNTTVTYSGGEERVEKHVESSYEVYKSDATWWEAVSDAERHGGQLVSINSEEEFRQICALAEKEDLVAFWAGICKTSSNDWNDSQWLDGTGFEYQNWLKNEPSGTDENGVAENFLLVFKVNDEWYYNDATHDVSNVYADKMGYIVEKKQEATSFPDKVELWVNFASADRNPGYNMHVNNRYGFQIAYPAHFERANPSTIVGETVYSSDDKSSVCKIYCNENRENLSASALYDKYVSMYGGDVTYKTVEDDFFAVSIQNDQLYHYMYFRVDEIVAGFEFHFYGSDNLKTYSQYIDEIYDSIRINQRSDEETQNLLDVFSHVSNAQTIEFTAQSDIDVYIDDACLSRGTYMPWSLYNAVINKGTICNIEIISPVSLKVNYQAQNGMQIGYIKTADLFTDIEIEKSVSYAFDDVDVYLSTANSCIEQGDAAWVVHTTQQIDGFQAVLYEAEKGTRGYKLGYILTEDIMLL